MKINFPRFFCRADFWLPLIFFLAFAAYGVAAGPHPFVRDSTHYWELRRTFFDHSGHFSLLNYVDADFQLRGYVFPLILLCVEWLLDIFTPDRWMTDSLTAILFNAATFLLLAWVLLPALFSRLTGQTVSLRFRALLTGLLFVFWRGFLFYPLSDFPALVFCLAGWLALLLLFQPFSSPPVKILLAFLAGSALMAAYLTRPVYLLTLGVAALALLFARAKNFSFLQRFSSLLAFLLAAALLLWPQYRINQIHYGLNSPWISDKLYAYHIANGFLVQRFEVNQDLSSYPLPNARYYDLQAQTVLQRTGLAELSLANLPQLFLRYPLDVTSVYFRHFFNGLSPFYDSLYVTNILRPDWFLLWLSYSIFFAVFYFFDWRRLFALQPALSVFTLGGWLLPVLTAVPAVTEARFYLPLNAFLLMIFSALCLTPADWRAKFAAEGWFRPVFFYLLFLLLCFALAGQILISVSDIPILLTPQ
ncbi:MAG: hypothetical protein Fur0035_08370 [Anaerolineales bacterium]